MFSWPVSSPFPIIHVDLWMPSKFTDSKDTILLMNVMYDIPQFVFVVSFTDEYSIILA